jgi:hypothetical protein
MTKKPIHHTKLVFSLLILVGLSISLFAPVAFAQVAGLSSDFNHMRTGFPLTGLHKTVTCETCHVGGVFKGTPTDCAGCHSIGRRVVATFKPPTHMRTTAACETCHTNTVSFLGARFNHIGVQPKACMSCHADSTAPGKPSGHIATNLSCDSCHRTSTWLPAGFDHAGALPACITCHNGTNAIGKPVNHIPTSAACDSCHKTGFTTFLGAIYDHANVTPGSCGTCHIPGTYGAKTKPTGHIPYTGNDCDSCHVGTGYISFAGSTMNHTLPAVASMGCSTCHNGSYISQAGFLGGPQGKPANHISTTSECNSSGCHSGFQTFAGLAFNHASASPAVAGRCDQCHNGSQALGKPSTHVVTTAQCDTCHGTANNYTSFAGAAFTHTSAVATICGTCHLGQTATVVTKPQAHIPTTGNACDSCHINNVFTPGGFAGAKMNHAAVIGTFTCITCHSGGYLSQIGTAPGLGAQVQPAGHIVTSASCDNCHHDASYMSFAGAVYDHSGVTPTTCGTCHIPGTSGAKTAPIGHIPMTKMSNPNACDSCHLAGYATFAGATMNHAAVPAYQCSDCHNGSYTSQGTTGAQWTGTVSNHILLSTQNCTICHNSTTSWAYPPEKMNHVSNGNTSTCKTCHNSSSTYLGNMTKKTLGNHEGSTTSQDCISCHSNSYTQWNSP